MHNLFSARNSLFPKNRFCTVLWGEGVFWSFSFYKVRSFFFLRLFKSITNYQAFLTKKFFQTPWMVTFVLDKEYFWAKLCDYDPPQTLLFVLCLKLLTNTGEHSCEMCPSINLDCKFFFLPLLCLKYSLLRNLFSPFNFVELLPGVFFKDGRRIRNFISEYIVG